MSDKQGIAWIQNLSKQRVIDELKSRGIEANEQCKLEELRRILKEDCKRKEQKPMEGDEQTGESEVKKGIRMEYTSKLDFKHETDEWEEFVERIELYFEANEIENEGKKEPFFSRKLIQRRTVSCERYALRRSQRRRI